MAGKFKVRFFGYQLINLIFIHFFKKGGWLLERDTSSKEYGNLLYYNVLASPTKLDSPYDNPMSLSSVNISYYCNYFPNPIIVPLYLFISGHALNRLVSSAPNSCWVYTCDRSIPRSWVRTPLLWWLIGCKTGSWPGQQNTTVIFFLGGGDEHLW